MREVEDEEKQCQYLDPLGRNGRAEGKQEVKAFRSRGEFGFEIRVQRVVDRFRNRNVAPGHEEQELEGGEVN